MPRTTPIWDLPVRVFHWLMALGVLGAAAIAFLLGERSPWFRYHMFIGLTLALMVALRLVWGFVGTRHARFGAFAASPVALFRYLFSVFTSKTRMYASHNPATAYFIVALVALVTIMTVTGIKMTTGDKSVKEIHELAAYGLLIVSGVHILGVIVHTIRHRELIGLAMVDGKRAADPAFAIGSSRPVVAIVFLAITAWWAGSLVWSFDANANTTRLPVIGTTLKLGPSEADRAERRARREARQRELEAQRAAEQAESSQGPKSDHD